MPDTFRRLFLKAGIVLFILMLSFACSRAPSGIISEKKMKDMLIDMQLAEFMIAADMQNYRLNSDKRALYQTVFDKYHVTEAKYDSSLIWYGQNLDLYMRIYKMALADVNKRIELMGDIKPEVSSSMFSADSVDIWVFRKYYELSPSALMNAVTFDFHPDDGYSNGSIFILGLQVWGLTSQVRQPVEMSLHVDQGDTTIVLRDTIHRDGYHEMMAKSLSAKRVNRVYGYVRMNASDSLYHKVYLDDFSMMKYKYGSTYIAGLDSMKQEALSQPEQ